VRSGLPFRSPNSDIRRRLILFRCWLGGTQEIDRIFGRFAETSLSGFDTLQLERLENLLDCADPDLFDWVSGRIAPPPAYDHDVMHLLRARNHSVEKG